MNFELVKCKSNQFLINLLFVISFLQPVDNLILQQICNDRMQFGATDHDKALTKPFDSHLSALCCKNQSDECLEKSLLTS